jgi:hypothetical protein
MNTSFKALIVPARLVHPVHLGLVQLDLPALQRLAGGEVGVVAGGHWHVYLDSGGNRYTENVRAEVLMREAGVELEEAIHGTAVFLGRGGLGEEADAPRHLIRLAEQLFDLPLAA